nr:MAG TPA: hypothetical protein [Caudoviricetes sp.]
MTYILKGLFILHNDYSDIICFQKIAELIRAYRPPDRPDAYRKCENCDRLSHCLDCWIEWFGDAVKMKGD